jgi:hypothetical protein
MSILAVQILPRDVVERALEIFRQMCARNYGEYRQYLIRKEHCAAAASRKPQHTAKNFAREQYPEEQNIKEQTFLLNYPPGYPAYHPEIYLNRERL